MKDAMPYLIVIAATFLLSGAVVVAVVMFKPGLLRGGTVTAARADSAAAPATPHVLRETAGPTLQELGAAAGRDSLSLMRDSLRTLLATLATERSRDGAAGPAVQPPTQPTSQGAAPQAKSVEPPGGAAPAAQPSASAPVQPYDSAGVKIRKSRAKMLESMPAEDAAKILARLPDDETRVLLQYIKARQAAKILAAFEPERASRFLR
jgi:hypothetical protein